MDSVNSLLERRNRYIAEHRPDSVQSSNTNQESSLALDESNIFEGDNQEKKEVESIEEKSDHSNSREDEALDESHEYSDGFIEIRVNKNFKEKESIFSNKIETNSFTSKYFS